MPKTSNILGRAVKGKTVMARGGYFPGLNSWYYGSPVGFSGLGYGYGSAGIAYRGALQRISDYFLFGTPFLA